MNLVIKYDIDGEFFENYFYEIVFQYTKSSNVLSLENKPDDAEFFLKEIDGKKVLMQYRGLSKIDNLPIFVLDAVKIRRNYKLENLI